MSTPTSTDPYVALGIGKEATLAEIRSAHRKLVLKCHPDKVQDPELKAVKQDEFQKVQQAYELLSDECRRGEFDQLAKLEQLKREMGRATGGSSPGKTVFDFEVREAVPRTTTFKTKSKDREPTVMYSQPRSSSFEDDLSSKAYEEARTRARKTASYEEPRRSSGRDEEKRRRAEDEELRRRAEKEAKKTAQGSAKKSRDKERKKGSEDKQSRRYASVEEDDSDESHAAPRYEKKSARRIEEEIRLREQEARDLRAAKETARINEESLTERTRKLNLTKNFAAEYMQASRRKASIESEDSFRPKPIRRAETFQETPARYTAPPTAYYDDDEFVRRSSARAAPRRASEQVPASRTREAPRSTSHRKASPTMEAKPFIVEAPPPQSARPPTLQTHNSAPPHLEEMYARKEPHRSRTMPTAYAPPPPAPISRASTFQAGDSNTNRERGSRLKTSMAAYASDGTSDSEDEPSHYAQRTASPPPLRRRETESRYVIDKSRGTIPVTSRHRTALREEDYESQRQRSISPTRAARRAAERPPLQRSTGSNRPSSTSRSASSYYASEAPPVVKEARPKMSPAPTRSPSGHYFSNIQYAPPYDNVAYTADGLPRRGSGESHARGGGYADSGRDNGYSVPPHVYSSRPSQAGYA